MKEITLKAQTRDSGKKTAKTIRRNGMAPGIFYLKGEDSISIKVIPLDMRSIVYTSATKIISLEIEGEEAARLCVLKDINFDPVTDKIVHFDLQGLKPGQKITIDIPIVIIGETPVGVRQGGKLMQTLYKLKASMFPRHIIEQIIINAEELEMNQSISLADIDTENLEFDFDPKTTICAVVPPRVSDEDEEGEEGEEGIEGEEGADAETTTETEE